MLWIRDVALEICRLARLCTSFSILGYIGHIFFKIGLRSRRLGLMVSKHCPGRVYKLDGAFDVSMSRGMPIAFRIESSLPLCERNTSHSA